MDADKADSCALHFPNHSCNYLLVEVSLKKWKTAVKCAKEWLELEEEPLYWNIAKKVVDFGDELRAKLFCHEYCYKRFTNSATIAAAHKRAEKRKQKEDADFKIPPKRTRSSEASLKDQGHVLPQACIICCKEQKFLSGKQRQSKTTRDKLCTAETLTAGKLLQSARDRGDERVLMAVGPEEDCVAREVQYHKTCFRSYTRPTKISSDKRQGIYKETYDSYFKPFIDAQVIGAKKIYKLAHLCTIYNRLIQEHEDPQAEFINRTLLKTRLTEDYPDLVIHLQSRKAGYIVYHASAVEVESGEGSTDDSDQSMSPLKISRQAPMSMAVSTQYMMKKSIENHQYQVPNPLRSVHVDVPSFEASVPKEITAYFSSLLESKSGAGITPSQQVKLNSICQDLMSLLSPQLVSTPKGLVLGLIVKHLTGSKELINILHRLGHSASYDTIRAYETSLAIYAMNNQDAIPDKFAYQGHITAVWDNIDFLEATKSGTGTTHHTNGVLIQLDHQVPIPLPSANTSQRPRLRSLAPTVEAMPVLPSHHKSNPAHLLGCKLPLIPDISEYATLEFIYALVRFQDEISKPSWTGFNKLTRSVQSSPKSVVSYLKTIEKPPIDLDVVNHILQKTLDQLDKFGLENGVVVFDQAVYSKAQTVRFLNPIIQSRLVPRLGEFHTVMTFLGVIGKRYGDAGMKDILVESHCIADGSLKGVINGHSYNRAIRANKLLMESLYDLLLEQYTLDCFEAASVIRSASTSKARLLLVPEHSRNIVSDVHDVHEVLYKPFQEYIKDQCQSNPTFRFWYGYIEMVLALLCFIRGTRESNWQLHLDSLRHLLPWFFAYDNHNYARYGSLYYIEMVNLQKSHPNIHDLFVSTRGSFTYQASHHKPFAAVACDQAIEQTINRDSKSKGGLVGMTLRPSASQRWLSSRSEKAEIRGSLCRLLNLDHEMFEGHEMTRKGWQADEDMRMNMKEIIQARINPFTHRGEGIVSIVSGKEASPEVQSDLEKAFSIGESKVVEFVQQRITTQYVDFSSALKSNKLKSFTLSSNKKNTTNVQISCSPGLFDRLLVISQQRTVDLKQVLSYSLGPISWSLAKPDGSLVKTAKSALMNAVEKDLNETCYLQFSQLPKDVSTLVLDGMAEIQATKPPATFGLYARVLLDKILSMAKSYSVSRVDFVCDCYPELSIKNLERERRGLKGGQRVTVYGPQQKIPVKFGDFLSIGDNKVALVKFLSEEWTRTSLQIDIALNVAFESECIHLKYSKDGGIPEATKLASLKTDHEEADTRMLLHVNHAMTSDDGSEKVILKSQDTDVLVICLATRLPSESLYLYTGHGDKARYIDIGASVRHLDKEFCDALLGLHAISGCDAVSSFYGKGKRTWYNHMKQHPETLNCMKGLGVSFTLSSDTASDIEKFVCSLYGNDGQSSINQVRYNVFCSPNKVSQHCLPPTQDELNLHTARANYQAAIWRRSISPVISAPSPDKHGWIIAESQIKVKWMSQDPAPTAILNTIYCACKTGCANSRCGCMKVNLRCTDVCRCTNCENCVAEDLPASDSESEDA